MSAMVGKIIVTVLALGCIVGAAFLPSVKTELIAASVGLLAWAHAPWPGDAAKQQMVGAEKEAAAQSVGLSTVGNPNLVILPPIPSPPNKGE